MEIFTTMMDDFEKDPATMQQEVEYPIRATFDFFEILLPHSEQFIPALRDMSSTVTPALDRLRRLLPSLPGFSTWNHNPEEMITLALSIANDPEFHAPVLADMAEWAFNEMIAIRKGGCNYVFCPRTRDNAHASRCASCDLARFCSKEVPVPLITPFPRS
jgi:hypothetical protein